MRRRPSLARGAGLACVLAAAGALIAGCGDDGDDADRSGAASGSARASTASSASASGDQLTEDQAERKNLVPKAKVGHDTALGTAVKAVDGSKPVSIELEGPADKPAWDAKVATDDGTEHTVRIDAVTGEAGRAEADADQDADDKRQLAGLLAKAKVSARQAAETATDRTTGTVTSVELDDTDRGGPMWSVDVVTTNDWNKTTYDIDATDRRILREHTDRD